MEKTFELVCIPKITLIYRGLAFEPDKQVRLVVTQKEFDFLKQYINPISFKEILEQVENIEVKKVSINETQNKKELLEDKPIQKPKPTQTQKSKPSTTTKSRTQTKRKQFKGGKNFGRKD